MWAEHFTQEKRSNGLTLPEVRDGVESDDDNGMIFEYRNRSLFMTSGGTKEKCFLGKHFAHPTITKSKKFLPNLKYQLKKNTHP